MAYRDLLDRGEYKDSPFSPFGGSGYRIGQSRRFSGEEAAEADQRYELLGSALESRASVEASRLAYERTKQAAKAGRPSGFDRVAGTVGTVGGAVAGIGGAVTAIAAI